RGGRSIRSRARWNRFSYVATRSVGRPVGRGIAGLARRVRRAAVGAGPVEHERSGHTVEELAEAPAGAPRSAQAIDRNPFGRVDPGAGRGVPDHLENEA